MVLADLLQIEEVTSGWTRIAEPKSRLTLFSVRQINDDFTAVIFKMTGKIHRLIIIRHFSTQFLST